MIIGNSAIHHIVSKAVAHTNLDTSDKDAYANAAAPTSPIAPISGNNDASAQSGTDDKQSYDEAFAKMMVNLKAATAFTTEEATDPQAVASMMAGADKQLASTDNVASGSSDNAGSDSLDLSLNQDSTSRDVGSAKDEFMDYMNQTDAEKVRQQMTGVSKKEYDAMTPEEQAAVDKTVAKLTKEKIEATQQQVKAKIAMAKAEMA